MCENILDKLTKYYSCVYTDGNFVILTLDSIDDIIFETPFEKYHGKNIVFITTYDFEIMYSIYKAILYGIDIKANSIVFALIDKQHENYILDYSVRPIYSTNCGHIVLTYYQLLHDLQSTSSYHEKHDNINKFFCLDDRTYVSPEFILGLIQKIRFHRFRCENGCIERARYSDVEEEDDDIVLTRL